MNWEMISAIEIGIGGLILIGIKIYQVFIKER